MPAIKTTASVVLVHGAWADGSSWAKVIEPLQSRGLNALAAPIPLTSLSDDIAALERAPARTDGPVVLVGHAYAGAVIGASLNERVRSLVFIAALAPDEGEAVGELFYREKPHPKAPQLAPDAHGLVWLPDGAFGAAFCQHASPEQAALLGAVQRPIALACIQEKAPSPSWKPFHSSEKTGPRQRSHSTDLPAIHGSFDFDFWGLGRAGCAKMASCISSTS